MGLIQLLFLVIFGIALLWFGYNLLTGQWTRIRAARGGYAPSLSGNNREQSLLEGRIAPDDPQSCPLCSIRLNRGETVNTHAFPSVTGGKDRLMHVIGCIYCI